MEEKLGIRHIKIIRSVERRDLGTFSEEVYHECLGDGEAISLLKEIELRYAGDPDYEQLQNLREYLTVSFRNRHTGEEIRFMTAD